ncbi:hypothetical protein SLEP1_g46687 [Rubroshorea leprosula]|uniref:Uncharacterized protein n=1 Tax=Rubroshorea leprosula TaxID=152421 RepID=A0AAV5LNR9_9ROSI|nr:hypothetical protein SLEP1_g46687 [Rubroshorea leprosula]
MDFWNPKEIENFKSGSCVFFILSYRKREGNLLNLAATFAAVNFFPCFRPDSSAGAAKFEISMEKEKSVQTVAASLKKLDLNPNHQTPESPALVQSLNSSRLRLEKMKLKPPSLVSLCLGVVGRHLEDIIDELGDIADSFPADIKMAIAAIARRRKLLSDDVLISLADSSWGILDLSGSEVSDAGLSRVADVCKFLRAVDISRCNKITKTGVSKLVHHCHLLETIRCGGCPASESTARRCLGVFKPKLNYAERDSWEELDTMEIGPESLRWLVWPNVDKNSLEILSSECPRVTVNPKRPKPSLFGFKGTEVPREALPDIALDDPLVKDIDPKTWIDCRLTPRTISPSPSNNTEGDKRSARKCAKNARQHQRRAEREWMMSSPTAKALVLASQAHKSLRGRRKHLRSHIHT